MNGEDIMMFETQEQTIARADWASRAPQTAKDDHAWHNFAADWPRPPAAAQT